MRTKEGESPCLAKQDIVISTNELNHFGRHQSGKKLPPNSCKGFPLARRPFDEEFVQFYYSRVAAVTLPLPNHWQITVLSETVDVFINSWSVPLSVAV